MKKKQRSSREVWWDDAKMLLFYSSPNILFLAILYCFYPGTREMVTYVVSITIAIIVGINMYTKKVHGNKQTS